MSFKSILIDLDASATAQPALECALALARTVGARLGLVDAFSSGMEPGPPRATGPLLRGSDRHRRLAALAEAVRPVRASSPPIAGTGVDAIVRETISGSHDLVVRARDRDLVAGGHPSVAEHLAHRCPSSLWIVGPGAGAAPARIAAAVDPERDDDLEGHLTLKVLDAAFQLAAIGDGIVHMLHAWQPSHDQRVRAYASDDEYASYLDSSEQRAAAGLARLADTCGAGLAGVRLALCRGAFEEVLPRFVVTEGIDVVVMGAQHRMRLLQRWRTGTAERLMKRLPCSVLIVRSSP